MRNRWLMVLVTLLAAFGLVFTGCGGGTTGGTFYTVTFDKNTDETVTGMPNAQQVAENSKVTKPSPAPTYEGHYVLYWSTDPDGEEDWDFDSDLVTEDMTLYAQWAEGEEPSEYDFVDLGDWTVGDGTGSGFSGWGTNGYDTPPLVTDLEIEVLLSAKYLVLELTGKPRGGLQLAWQGVGEGFAASDWFSNTVLQNTGDPAPAFGASWDAEENLLTFELSTCLKDYDKFLKSTGGAKILIGYWSSALEDLGVISAYLIVPAAAPETVTVSFDTNGGTPATIASIQVTKGYPMGRQYPDDPTKDGSVFGGWFDADDEQYVRGTQINENVTLIAKWVTPLTVSFDTNGGLPDTIEDVEVGEGLTLGDDFPAAPSKSGYVFGGWYVGEIEYTADSPITADVTLVAKWINVWTVTFDLNYEGAPDATTREVIDNGELGTLPTTPVRDGYSFDGWFDGETQYTATKAVTADVTLKAKWTPLSNPTVITFMDGDEVYETVSMEQGPMGDNFPDDPTPPYGYSFVGWFVDVDDPDTEYTAETPVTVAELTLVAKYAPSLVVALDIDPENEKQWVFTVWHNANELSDLGIAKYIVIESVSDVNNVGYGGLQFGIQGDGVNDWKMAPIFATRDWTNFSHSDTETVYFVIDLSTFPNHAQIAADETANQAQVIINWGLDQLGEFTGYLTNKELVKPVGAVDLIDESTGGGRTPTDTIFGYITKVDVLGLNDE